VKWSIQCSVPIGAIGISVQFKPDRFSKLVWFLFKLFFTNR